ncbi:hypothetical protein B0T26DRAFT_635829 [Lasiosphaeria miniovina]|uniref:Glycosyltransferase family 28 N-terminal domain-containing protein n=1 Tax=Lasiosphaeria miniovina TaxID=1954250 RepID=A0AA40EDY7_9PEZI|nr:uncharacterized protein B0T26DRAFT_635829 [Lasiosphaeria miniovina]KAK0733941.1 hypothetical protein B0T26DRAFT_635829 [Lasiosphaeria miniovina]
MGKGGPSQTTTLTPMADQDEPPPPYGDHFDQIQLSQAGFEAGAAVTDDGRVNININQKNRRLSELLAPALRKQVLDLQTAPSLPSGPLPPPYIPASLGGEPGQVPPPPLNVVIQIVGSRGDVQPFVALGQVLRDTYGHRVRLATHPTFQKFVEENGLEFFSIGGDPAELMAFMVKNPGLMPGIDAFKGGEIKKRREGIEQILMGCWRSCIEAGNGLGPPPPQHRSNEPVDDRYILPGNPCDKPFVADAIIANPPSFAHIHVAEKLGIPLHMTFTMPWSPTRSFPHPLANIESTNTDTIMANYLSYTLVDMMTWQGLGDVINRFRSRVLGLDPLSMIWAPGLLNRLRVPTTYCWSPALIPKPADWASEITISGFYFLNLASSYIPEPDLAMFLAAGPPPVYIGFGSIVVDDPNTLTRTIFGAVAKTGVRALVSKGWGGLGTDAVGMPEGVFMLGNCPHDWLFQHVSAVVHHGGAGTSAAGIKMGKPTVVVPFFGDQPFWGSMIAKAGAGPDPIPYKKLTAENLAAAISEALKPETQALARELGAKICEEKGADVGGKSFHEFLDTDNLRCTLAPSRAAAWRVRRTQLKLSTLAGEVLVKKGYLKYSDLKLYRSKEHNTEDQPWDPISAVTSALVGDLGSLTMAVTDFPREIFKGSDGKKDKAKAGALEVVTPLGKAGEGVALTGDELSVTAPGAKKGQSSLSSEDLSRSSTAASQTSTSSNNPFRNAARSSSGNQNNRPGPQSTPSPSAKPFNMDSAIDAGKGVGRIVDTSMKMPMNLCMGLARGFRNAPRLYGDETIRPTEKVTDFASGLKVAGKEFGLGFFDGVSGLVTQPLKGAEKDGARGFLKGFGKGIGGLVFKPAAAVWSIPAYTMQGVHAEVRSMFIKSNANYIITSRVLQGKDSLVASTAEEQRDIILRWQTHKDDLHGLEQLKQKENAAAKQRQEGGASSTINPPRLSSFDGWKKLQAHKDSFKRFQGGTEASVTDQPFGPTTAAAANATGNTSHTPEEDEEFEHAIRASVQQTSCGDQDEDAQIEAAIRASVNEMRHMAEQTSTPGEGIFPSEKGALPAYDQELAVDGISDEEYQALVEEAVRQSLLQQQQHGRHTESFSEGNGKGVEGHGDGEDIELRKAMDASKLASPAQISTPSIRGSHENSGDDETEQLRRALEESEKEHALRARQLDEERTVLDYVKRQSLAEEEYKLKSRDKDHGKGKGVDAVQEVESGEDDDEDFKRALEESLRVSGRSGGTAGEEEGQSSFK